MCTVQVLLIADVMRRTTYENTGVPRPSARSICRRLFADDAPAARPSNTVLKSLQADIEREMRLRWNFDFQNETPLPGRYQWEPVNPASSRVPPSGSVVTEVAATTSTDDKQKTQSVQQTIRSKSTTQSKITDYLHQRKRQRSKESDLISPKLKSRRTDSSSTNCLRPSASMTRSTSASSSSTAD